MTTTAVMGSAKVDGRSGFCNSSSTFYSKRKPIPLPHHDSFFFFFFSPLKAQDYSFAEFSPSHHKSCEITFTTPPSPVDPLKEIHRQMGILMAMAVVTGHELLGPTTQQQNTKR
ncbi:hypothetical protein PRUPE_6G195000 [Prunus persica]|uniref:Uncharacterized protein n=1 Tax=Prunus persica TaxID=3760 RepID=M5WEK9_PRUPE|nr:hypothetical protein PRUPE_6G195000 [Prunus persica]